MGVRPAHRRHFVLASCRSIVEKHKSERRCKINCEKCPGGDILEETCHFTREGEIVGEPEPVNEMGKSPTDGKHLGGVHVWRDLDTRNPVREVGVEIRAVEGLQVNGIEKPRVIIWGWAPGRARA